MKLSKWWTRVTGLESLDQELRLGQPLVVGRAVGDRQDVDALDPRQFFHLPGEVPEVQHRAVLGRKMEVKGEAAAEDVVAQPSDSGGNGRRLPVKPGPNEHGSDEPEIDLLGADLIRRHLDVCDLEGPSLDLVERVACLRVALGTRSPRLPLHVAQAIRRGVDLRMVPVGQVGDIPRVIQMPVGQEEEIDPIEILPADWKMRSVPREAAVERVDHRLQVSVADVIVRRAMPGQQDPFVRIRFVHLGVSPGRLSCRASGRDPNRYDTSPAHRCESSLRARPPGG